jgi:hypothetical protein
MVLFRNKYRKELFALAKLQLWLLVQMACTVLQLFLKKYISGRFVVDLSCMTTVINFVTHLIIFKKYCIHCVARCNFWQWTQNCHVKGFHTVVILFIE